MSRLVASERVRHELVRRTLRVSGVSRPAPNMVRVTLSGEDLKGFVTASPSDHIKVFFPDLRPGHEGDEAMRDYTPLEFRDGSSPELDIDIVVHGDEGPASYWATKAQPGDELRIGGPRGSYIAPTGIEKAVLIGDESALPAISRWLKKFEGSPVTVLLSVADDDWQQYLHRSDADVRWFSGADRGPEREAALRTLDHDDATFYYLAGEATGLVPLRRYLRRELGLEAVQVKAEGFWKLGSSDFDHHAPLDASDPD